MEKQYVVYMIKCADESLYTGITTDIKRRVAAHNSGRGAKYTRGRGPVEVVYLENCGNKAQALVRELEIKGLKRKDKLDLARNGRGC